MVREKGPFVKPREAKEPHPRHLRSLNVTGSATMAPDRGESFTPLEPLNAPKSLTRFQRKPRILEARRLTPRRSGGMEDAADSKSAGSNTVGVRIPPPAPSTTLNQIQRYALYSLDLLPVEPRKRPVHFDQLVSLVESPCVQISLVNCTQECMLRVRRNVARRR